jgi:hypothetical protein
MENSGVHAAGRAPAHIMEDSRLLSPHTQARNVSFEKLPFPEYIKGCYPYVDYFIFFYLLYFRGVDFEDTSMFTLFLLSIVIY